VNAIKTQLKYLGTFYSADGISPSPTKVNALNDAAPPTSKEEVRSLLGLATYCARFIPRLATISKPLRKLTTDSTVWKWGEPEEDALQSIKNSITEHCSMAYFNPKSSTEVVVDACPVGLCAMLVQQDNNGKSSMIALASRSLKPVVQRYSQTKREALAVTWGCIHFHLYLFGAAFTIVTDHKSIVSLFNNVHSKPSVRMERWILKLQQYTYQVVYRPGKSNPADYLSRHPLSSTKSELETEET
jgi:hypothetical protein